MIRMFVRHAVVDYDTWRAAYDAFDADRQGMGVKGHEVCRGVDDPNEVTIWHDFESLEIAQSFASSPRLQEAMGAAGVTGELMIWFTAAP